MKDYVVLVLSALILESAFNGFANEVTFIKSQDLFPFTVTIYKSNGVSYKITEKQSKITLDLDKINGEYVDGVKAESVDKSSKVLKYTSTPRSKKKLNKMIEQGLTKIVMRRIDDDPYYPGTKTIYLQRARCCFKVFLTS